MKIEFHLEGPRTVAWFQSALSGYREAAQADREENDAKWDARMKVDAEMAKTEAAPAEVETAKEPAKRGRKKADEPAAQITTSPEDRKPNAETEAALEDSRAGIVTRAESVEDIVEAEVVNVFEDAPAPKVYTRDDVKAAMQVYVAEHGMDKLAANASTLLGAPKLSAIPEDAAAFGAAIKRLEAATNA